jgi:hypothetical protein
MLLSENWDLNLEMCGNTHVGQTATLMLNPHLLASDEPEEPAKAVSQ